MDTYITTENFEDSGEHRGRVQILDCWQSENLGSLAFVDLLVTNSDGEFIELRRIEWGKLRWLVDEAHRNRQTLSHEDSLARTGWNPSKT